MTMLKALNTQADVVKEGEIMFSALGANAADLGHLAGSRDKLGALLEQFRDLLVQQQDATAVRLEASRQLQQVQRAATALIVLLRRAVQEHYGTRNDKLAAFGVQPFRGRRRGAETPTVVPPPALE
jgi:hypothetical protein